MVNILFVCLGNICRSPMAEAILNHKIKLQNLSEVSVASCGTAGYHIGDPPDKRTIEILKRHKIDIHHVGQQLKPSDLDKYTHIFVMDDANMRDVLKIKGDNNHKANIYKMRNFDNSKSGLDVEDPWYGTLTDFEACYQILNECCDNILSELKSS